MPSASWIGEVDSNYFNTANWAPAIVPGSGELAFFNGFNTTTFNLTLAGATNVGGWIFDNGDFQILASTSLLAFNGMGIVSDTGNVSLLTVSPSAIYFQNASSAGSATLQLRSLSELRFLDDSTAGNAHIINHGLLHFFQSSSAGNAIIDNYAVSIAAAPPSILIFENEEGAANATINNFGTALFLAESTAGTATINTESNGETVFSSSSTAGTAIITTKTGGLTRFLDASTGGNAQFVTENGGTVNFSTTGGPTTGASSSHKITAGSIGGGGTYVLGQNELTVGSNDLSTTVSGIISGDGGSLVKIGTGTLKLSGANTFDAGITLNEGTLDFASLKAAGTGDVNFETGTQALIIENAALSAKTFANEIHDFGIGDAIELSGLKFIKGHTNVSYNATTDLLKITNGKVTDKLHLADPETNFFKVQNDGGHVKVIITATAARHHAKVAAHDDGGDDLGRGFQLDSHHASVGGHDFF